MSRVFDDFSLHQTPFRFRVDAAYKRKADKVKPVDTSQTDGSGPGGDINWRDEAIRREKPVYEPGVTLKFSKWLIPKFSSLARGSRLKPERLQKMIVGDGLTPIEKNLLTEMLFNREAALAWDFSKIGRVRPEVAPLQKIRTIKHTAWQVPGFRIPRALNKKVADILREHLAKGIVEPCHRTYRNPWYVVKKKLPGEYRLVNSAVEANRVTIRDANMPPNPDKFSEEFAGCFIGSLIDWFSGYDQVTLDIASRDLTAIQTPLGLIRMTTLPQGATNSVAQFSRVVAKILQAHMPHRALPFIDDIGVKGAKTDYNGEEVKPGLHRYVLEHI